MASNTVQYRDFFGTTWIAAGINSSSNIYIAAHVLVDSTNTNIQAVKAASTPPVATDVAAVVSLSPNSVPTQGASVCGTSTGAAQANSPTMPAVASKFNYCAGFAITGLGATSAGSVAVTLGDGTLLLNFTLPIPAGVTVGITPLIVYFDPPLKTTAVNTAWTLTCASFGTGNTQASACIWGTVL
jgi:hypothetical protein